jgi:hypothetical protein
MIEKVTRLAIEAGMSRRGFFGRFAGLAAGAVLGLMALAPPAKAGGNCFDDCMSDYYSCFQDCADSGGLPRECLHGCGGLQWARYCQELCEGASPKPLNPSLRHDPR